MEINSIYLSPTDNRLYIVKGGKIYTADAAPYRKISDADLQEVKTPLSVDMYVKARHLFEPTESFLRHDLRVYGLKREDEE